MRSQIRIIKLTLGMPAPEPIADTADEKNWKRTHDDRHAEVGGGGFGVAHHAGGAGPGGGGD
jgi:hypothetical protein